MKKTILFTLTLFLGITLFAQSEKRIALVIGNNNYPGKELKNPVNDANLMERTLEDLGFDVIKITNATKSQMEKAFSEFSGKISAAKVTMIYFAGHGMQIDGVNYLMPIDAKPDMVEQVAWQAIDINTVINRLKFYPNNLNIIVLDACRNDPFRSWARSDAQGFKRMEARGTIIGYATCEGCTADDNPTGSNGLYTSKLVAELKKPQEIIDVFRNTRFDVMEASKQKQRPMVSDLSTGRFYLKKVEADNPVFRPGEAEIKYGKININTEIGGTLYLDGKKLGNVNANTKNNLLQKITTGNHHVKISGSETFEQYISVYENQIAIINAKTKIIKETTVVNNTTAAVNRDFTVTAAGLNIAMRGIQGGSFKMGSNENDREKPIHTVNLTNFAMSKYEVTNAEFCAFLNEKGNQTEGGAEWINLGGSYKDEKCRIYKSGSTFKVESGYERHPVIYVSWYAATAFAKWLSEKTSDSWRLPSEAEWEYAAKGGQNYKYAGSDNINEVAWYTETTNNKGTKAVGTKKANAYGLYDMSGNVWEWCSDKWHGNYESAPTDGSSWESGNSSIRVDRGGCWINYASFCRVASRYDDDANSRYFSIGFRLCRSL